MARGGLISGLISGAVKAGSGLMAGRLQGEQALREREHADAEREERRMQQELNLSLLRGRVQDQQTEEAGESGGFDALHASDPQRYPTRIPGISYRRIYESGATSSQRTTPAPEVNRAAYERVPATAFPGGRKPAFSTAQNWVDVEKGWINGERQQQNRVEVYVQTPPRGRGGSGGRTVAQERSTALRSAKGIAAQGVTQGFHDEQIRVQLRNDYGDALEEGEIQGIVAEARRRATGDQRAENREERAAHSRGHGGFLATPPPPRP